jgi:hypothetical protein
MPWVRTPAIASKDESHPFPDRATSLSILRPHARPTARRPASNRGESIPSRGHGGIRRGIAALTEIPAAVAVVQHRAPQAPSLLAHVLNRRSAMPRTAIGTGMVDFILPLASIAPKLLSLAGK